MSRFRLGELFCGAGGLGLGARLAATGDLSIAHVWATDFDRDSCHTYEQNLMPEKIFPRDVRKLDFSTLEKAGEIDALAFGFPCNDFSVVGKKAGISGSYGSLYTYCVAGVHHFNPKWFVAENVGGLKNSDDGNTLRKILREFAAAGDGYKIYPHLYKFDKYGVPQKRQRIIVVGIRRDQNVAFGIPSPSPYQKIDVTAQTALKNIRADSPNHEFTRQSQTVIERLRYIKPGENAFNASMPDDLRLNVNGAKLSLIYRRLRPDHPSYTITGSGGGGTHVYHWKKDRALTNRERARLQSFPDKFIFVGQKESVRKQIGMAVPPQAAKVVFRAVLKTFAGKHYPVVQSNMDLGINGVHHPCF